MPPLSGGMNDQDYRNTIEMEFLDRIYSVVSRWRKGKVNDGSEQELIIWLTKEGLMAKDG
ncbi:MAG: hypothetical protein PHV98_00750 [Candidatus Omnitrophica bacterium]|nr:hypothetical protein [Candidatus Omnitrophota bacterium]